MLLLDRGLAFIAWRPIRAMICLAAVTPGGTQEEITLHVHNFRPGTCHTRPVWLAQALLPPARTRSSKAVSQPQMFNLWLMKAASAQRPQQMSQHLLVYRLLTLL